MLRWFWGALLIATACASSEKSEVPAAETVVVAAPATVTLDQFKEIHSWLQGLWRGSGGAYPLFFEEYRVVNDSTIRMRAFTDSTRQAVSDSAIIEWRNGAVRSRRENSTNDVIGIGPDSIRFIRTGETRGGHTFRRVSPDEWTATLHPAQSQGQVTVYVMRRIGP